MQKNKVLKNEYIFSVFSRLILAISGLLVQILISRYLGAELRGQTSYILNFTSISTVILTFGLPSLIPSIRRIFQDLAVINVIMTINFIVSVFYFIMGVLIVFLFKNTPIELIFSILLTPLFSYNAVSDSLCLIERPNARNRIVLFVNFLELIMVLLLFFFTEKSIFFGILYVIFSQLVKIPLYRSVLGYKIKFIYCNKSIFFHIIKFGPTLMLSVLLTVLNYKLTVLLLRYFDNISLAEIGIFTVGISIAEKGLLIPDAIKEILFSRLSKQVSEDEVAKIIRFSFLTCILISILIIFVSYFSIEILFGDEFSGAFEITVILSIGIPFLVFMKMIDSYNQVKLEQNESIKILLVIIIVNIVCNFLFVPIFGIIGGANALLVSYLLSGILYIRSFIKRTDVNFYKLVVPQIEDFYFFRNFFKV
ncbi:TPA: polysaccharide biosynthesis C-terminal domain-containing protein [Streptococcus suis]